MESSVIRIGLICVGVLLIVLSIRLNAVKKMVVNHAVIWSLVGLFFILIGLVPIFSSWTKLLSPGTVVVLFGVGTLFLLVEFQNSLSISQLVLKNRELAMDVAILSEECTELMEKVEKIQCAEEKMYEKDTLYN